MLWQNNKIGFGRISILFLALSLTGCGFTPLYGKKGEAVTTSHALAGVIVETNHDRNGHQLKADLEDLLNPGGLKSNPTYRLNISVSTTVAAIGVARDGTVSRYNVYLDSKYTLLQNDNSKVVTSGTLRQVGSYNNQINAYFSTYISEEDAIKRGITELAELYRQRLAVYLDAGVPTETESAPSKIPAL